MSRCECCQAAVAHVEALTPTETTVLTLLAKGLTTKELAKMLGGAPYTVNDHIKAIYKKLGIDSRAEAGVMACQMGLLRGVRE